MKLAQEQAEVSDMETLASMEAAFLAPIASGLREKLRVAAMTGEMGDVPELLMRLMTFRVATATTTADERNAVRMFAQLSAMQGRATLHVRGTLGRKNEPGFGAPELTEITHLAIKAGVVDAG